MKLDDPRLHVSSIGLQYCFSTNKMAHLAFEFKSIEVNDAIMKVGDSNSGKDFRISDGHRCWYIISFMIMATTMGYLFYSKHL